MLSVMCRLSGLGCFPFLGCSSIIAVNSLIMVVLIACWDSVFGPCFVMKCFVSFLVFQSSFMGKKVLVALHLFCS